MRAVIVPPRAGALSAVGLLCSPRQRELVRSWPTPGDHAGLADARRAIGRRGRLGGRRRRRSWRCALDCRYQGQSHELTVASVDEFGGEHERRNGYSRPGAPIEVVALRARARRPAPLDPDDLPPASGSGSRARPWRPNPTAPCGFPKAGRPNRTGPAPGCSQPMTLDLALDPAVAQSFPASPGVAEEMGAVLRRAAFSPNIKERADCSAALFTPAGELLAQAEHIPVHLGSMPASVRGGPRRLRRPARGPATRSSSTTPSPAAPTSTTSRWWRPASDDGRLVGWAANRAHHADVGGMAPGSIPPEATEIYQEGLRIPPVLLTPRVEAMLSANSRTPRRAARRSRRPAGGQPGRRRPPGRLWPARPARRGRRLRRAPHAGRPGRPARRDAGRSTTSLDSTGAGPDQPAPARIALTLTIAGETATFDFTGTDQQRPGNVNAVEAVTVSAVAFALRSATDPTIPANGGAMRPVTIVAPPGTLVAARPPAAVGAGNVEVSQRVADVCLGALAQARPDRVGAAGQGTMNNLLIGGDGLGLLRDDRRRPGRPPGPGRDERRPHRHDQYAKYAHGGPGTGFPAEGPALPPAAGERGDRPRRGRRRASSGTSRSLRTAPSA